MLFRNNFLLTPICFPRNDDLPETFIVYSPVPSPEISDSGGVIGGGSIFRERRRVSKKRTAKGDGPVDHQTKSPQSAPPGPTFEAASTGQVSHRSPSDTIYARAKFATGQE